MRTAAEIEAAVDAFNREHPPRPSVPAEPIRFGGTPAPESLVGFAAGRVVPFRGVYSTRTGHNRTWKGEIRNPR